MAAAAKCVLCGGKLAKDKFADDAYASCPHGCGGKKHPAWCSGCYWSEFSKATKAAPFQVRAVLEMEDSGPLGDNCSETFPTCLSANADWWTDYRNVEGYALKTAVEMLKEGRGGTFTAEDRSIIMKAFAAEKKSSGSKDLLAEFFPLMKPYLGGKKEGKKPTSIGAAKTGVKAAKVVKVVNVEKGKAEKGKAVKKTAKSTVAKPAAAEPAEADMMSSAMSYLAEYEPVKAAAEPIKEAVAKNKSKAKGKATKAKAAK